jgi:hypothetical protein
VKRPKFKRFGVSTGTKVQQENMRKLGKQMAKDPKMVIPECIGDCGRCPLDRQFVRLQRIQRYKDKPVFLNRLARSGRQFERAYAAMLLLAVEDTPIKFAMARLPSGDVNYTIRGKVKKEVLIGFEHFDDVELSLLAYTDFAKRNIHIYSSSEALYCSGMVPNYPKELIAEVLRSTGYHVRKIKNDHLCEHLADKSAHGQILNLEILSAGTSISVCRSCSSKKKNLYAEFNKRLITRKPERDFSIVLEQRFECVKGDKCSVAAKRFDTKHLVEKYRSGELADRELLEMYGEEVRESLGRADAKMLIIGGKCFERNIEAFIDALSPSDIERKALTKVLGAIQEPIIVDSGTPSAVLSLFWDKAGASAIQAVTGDKELARKIFQETKDTNKTPSQILREADMERKSKTVLGALPKFKDLGKIGSFADGIARTYKTQGKQEALREIDRHPKSETKLKSVSCGLLMAMNALKGKEWQFTKEELDYGRYLADFACALLDADPNKYRDALQNLLTASGSGEQLK